MNRLSKTIRALMPNCREAIRLQSDALDRPLSFWHRAGLRVHLLLCKWCRRYGRQIAFLRTIAQGSAHGHQPEETLPGEARERIKKNLKTAVN
jgi:hypothetical protein